MSKKNCIGCTEDFVPVVQHQKYCTKQCRVDSNREKDLSCIRQWHLDNPKSGMVRTVRHRAKKKGLEFNLTKEDFTIPEFCPVLGLRLEQNIGNGHGGADNSPSIDRIDNTKGYIKGNVQVISRLANAMKSNATPEQLIEFARWVMEVYS